MNKKIIQKITYHVRAYNYTRANDDKAGLYLGLTINRDTKKIPIEIFVKPELWDAKKETIKYNGLDDLEIRDLNLLINKEKGKANELLRKYRLAERPVNHDQFKRDFLNYASLDNFLSWSSDYLEHQKLNRKIAIQTYKNKKSRLNHFVNFAKKNKTNILFSDLTPKLISDFDTYLKRTVKLAFNSQQAVHVSIQSFIKQALDEGINLDNPYKVFKIANYIPGDRYPIEEWEKDKLKKLYKSNDLSEIEKEVLRKFLFSCDTGLRISDSKNIKYENIENNILKFHTIKGERFGKKAEIYLTDFAGSLLRNEQYGLIFKRIADQTVNKILKEIGIKAEIKTKLTFHVARDTFGTDFIEKGGGLATLSELMTHSDIKTTMIYVKIREKKKIEEMKNFNK